MANLLTGIRLLLILPVAWSMADEQLLPGLITLLLILLAIFTDYFDGIVARARGTASPKGMLFDHGTDFIFVTSGLAGLAWAGHVHWLLPAAIVIAFSQYVLDSYFLFRQKQLRMSFLGKWNGILYFLPLVIVALARTVPAESLNGLLLSVVPWTGTALLISTFASIIDRGVAEYRQSH